MNKETLINRNYKDISICQLDGCSNPILKKTKKKRNKYCCDEHAQLARSAYRKLWCDMNREKIKEYNKKYQAKLKKNKKRYVLKRHCPNIGKDIGDCYNNEYSDSIEELLKIGVIEEEN